MFVVVVVEWKVDWRGWLLLLLLLGSGGMFRGGFEGLFLGICRYGGWCGRLDGRVREIERRIEGS